MGRMSRYTGDLIPFQTTVDLDVDHELPMCAALVVIPELSGTHFPSLILACPREATVQNEAPVMGTRRCSWKAIPTRVPRFGPLPERVCEVEESVGCGW